MFRTRTHHGWLIAVLIRVGARLAFAPGLEAAGL